MKREKDIPDYREYPPKVRRMALQMVRHGDDEADVLEFISSAKGIDESDRAAVGDWFMRALPEFEKRYPPDDARDIMEGCACCKGGIRHAEALRIRGENPDYRSRLDALAQCRRIIWGSLEIVSEDAFRVNYYGKQDFYTCSCLRYGPGNQPAPMPESYCWCCAGHIKGHCETALGVKLEARVVSTALASLGQSPCVFELRVKK